MTHTCITWQSIRYIPYKGDDDGHNDKVWL